MLTTSAAAAAPVNVCHYCRLLLKISLPLPLVSRCARDRPGDLSRRSLNCPYAPVLREESWLPANHRPVFLSFRTRRRRCIYVYMYVYIYVYMYIYNPVNRTPLCILRRVRRVVEPRSRAWKLDDSKCDSESSRVMKLATYDNKTSVIIFRNYERRASIY